MSDFLRNRPTPVIQEKAERVEGKSQELQWFMNQDANELYRSVVGHKNGNESYQQEVLRDAATLTHDEWLAKYPGQGDAKIRFAEQSRAVDKIINGERTARETRSDALLDTGAALSGLFGDTISLGALPIDLAFGTDYSADLAQRTSNSRQWFQDRKSPLQKQRNELHALQGHLNQEESKAKYEKDIADGDSKFTSRMKKIGRDVVDGLSNYADDPSMIGQVAVEGATFLVPMATGARVMGKAKAISHIAKTQGITKAAAKAQIKAGKHGNIVSQFAMQSVPTLTAVMEGASGFSQGQMEILGLTEEELKEIPEYQALRKQGLTHDQAQIKLARSSGVISGGLSALAGYATGHLGRAFEANPLSLGSSKGAGLAAPALAAGKNIATETVEEGLQEGSNQLAVNIGKNAVGLETDLDEGLGESIASGVVGGAAVSGGMQAPGVALGTTKEVGKEAAALAKEGVDRAFAVREDQARADSVISPAAKEEATLQLETTAAEIIEGTAEPVVTKEGQTEPSETPTISDEVRQAVSDAISVPDTLAEKTPVENGPLRREDGNINRVHYIDWAIQQFRAAKEDQVKTGYAFLAIQQQQALIQALGSLPKGEGISDAVNGFAEALKTLEANFEKDIKEATETVAAMTKEHVRLFDLKPEDVVVLAQINPTLIEAAKYQETLNKEPMNQDSPTLSEPQKKVVQNGLAVKQAAESREEAYARVAKQYDALIEGDVKASPRPTYKEVSQQIRTGGNQDNHLPSIMEHHSRVEQAALKGDTAGMVSALNQMRGFGHALYEKTVALRTSAQNNVEGKGKPQKFMNFNGETEFPDTNATTVHLGNPNSLAFAKETMADAEFAAKAYNNLLKTYGDQIKKDFPEFEGEYLKKVNPVKEIEDAFQKTETTQEAKPEPEQKPAEEAPKSEKTEKVEETKQEKPAEKTEKKETSTKTNDQKITREERQRKTLTGGLTTNLVRGQNNPITKLFKRRKGGSNFLTYDDPAKDILDNIEELHKLDTNALTEPLTDKEQASLKWMLKNILPSIEAGMNKHFTEMLQRPIKEGSELTWADVIQREAVEGKPDALSTLNTKVFTFVQKHEDGSFSLDPRFVQAAIMGVLETTMINHARGEARIDQKEAKAMLSLGDANVVVSEQLIRELKRGRPLKFFVRNSAQTMERILGLKAKDEADSVLSEGLMASLVNETVHMMENTKLPAKDSKGNKIQASLLQAVDNTLTVPNGNGGTRSHRRQHVELNAPFKPLVELLQQHPDIFSVLQGEARTRHVGTPPTSTKKTQHRNPLGTLTNTQKQVEQERNNTPYTANVALVKLFTFLGNDASLKIMGHKEILDTMHKETAASIESRNRSYERAWDNSFAYLKDMLIYGKQHKMSLKDVPVYFEHVFTKVGRLQQQGIGTPQSDKFMRMLLTPTKETLSLKDWQMKNPEAVTKDLEAFWVMFAQATGVKVHKQPNIAAIVKAGWDMANIPEVVEAKEALKDALNQKKGSVDRLVEAMAKAETTKFDLEGGVGFQALVDLARIELALEQGKTEFTTHLYAEADGVTDGPVNASVHNLTGIFTPTQLRQYAKGGYLPGNRHKSLNDFTNDTGEGGLGDADDIYTGANKRNMEKLRDTFHTLSNKPANKESMGRVLRLVGGLLGKKFDPFNAFSDITDDLSEDRNLVKNPMTQLVYGAGTKSLSGSLVGDMFSKFYEELSAANALVAAGEIKRIQDAPFFAQFKLSNGENLLFKDLNYMMSANWDTERNMAWPPKEVHNHVDKFLRDPKKAVFSEQDFLKISYMLKKHYTEHMANAIDEISGGIRTEMQFAQFASGVQAAIFQDALDKLTRKKNQELGYLNAKGQHKGQKYLTNAQLREIIQEALKVAPIYTAADQEFVIADTEKVDANHPIARLALVDKNPRIIEGTSVTSAAVGVKVSPTTVQGMGDAQMVLNIYKDENGALKASLPVFDGINISAKNLDKGAEHINKATFNAWVDGNIHEMLYESMKKTFLGSGKVRNMRDMSKDARELLQNSVLKYAALNGFIPYDAKADLDEQIKHLVEHGDMREIVEDLLYGYDGKGGLRYKAISVKARKEVMKIFPSHTDHMALKGNSYYHPGDGSIDVETFSEMSLDEKAELMNEKYHEIFDRLMKAELGKDESPAVEPPSKEMKAALDDLVEQDIAIRDEEQDVTYLPKTAVPFLISAMRKAGAVKSRATEGTIQALLEGADAEQEMADYTVIFGSRKHLQPISAEPLKGTAQIDHNDKRIYIVNQSAETTLHELLHAATYGKLQAALADNAPDHARAATKRLRVLVDDFLKLDPTSIKEPKEGRKPPLYQADHKYGRTGVSRAYVAAANTIQIFLKKAEATNNEIEKRGHEAAAISELISWSLTNQHLQEVLKDQKSVNPLVRIARTTIKLLKRILGVKSRYGDDMLSQIRFNAEVVVKARTETPANFFGNIQNQGDPNTVHLASLENEYLNKLRMDLESRPVRNQAERDLQDLELALAIERAEEAEARAHQAGFDLSDESGSLFRTIHTVMMEASSLDGAALREATRVHKLVTENLTEESFLEGIENPTADDREIAKNKYDFLTGISGLRTSAKGSDQAAVFLALSQVDHQLRDILHQMKLPKRFEKTASGMDGLVQGTTQMLTNTLSEAAVGSVTHPNTLRHLDRVASVLATVEAEREQFIADRALSKVGVADEYLKNKITEVSKIVSQKLDKVATKANNSVLKRGASLGANVADLFDPAKTAQAGDAVTKMFTDWNVFRPIREVLFDIVGETDGNTDILSLLNKARYYLDRTRQNYRTEVTKAAREVFEKEPTKQEWRHMHKGLIRTDVLSLGVAQATEVLSDLSTLDQRIQDAENDVTQLSENTALRRHGVQYLQKAKDLAAYMVHREVRSQNLLRNASAIARLLDGSGRPVVDPAPELVRAISRLTTLYALKETDQDTLASLGSLLQAEPEGMRKIMAAVHNMQAEEQSKRHGRSGTEIADNNGWKGYAPVVPHAGRHTIIAPEADHVELVHAGYVKIKRYTPARGERLDGPHAVYRTKVGGKPAFRQGVAHSIHSTFMGVDSNTGVSRGSHMGEAIMGSEAKSIRQRMGTPRDNLPAGNYLLPIFDGDNKLIGYQRPFSEAETGPLNEETDLAEILGIWMGRSVEERLAKDLNRELVVRSKEKYDTETDRRDEYINIAQSNDPVIKAAWDSLGWEIKEDAKEIFGEDKFFPVRDDLVNVSLGFHRASATDAWSGTSRWSKETQDMFRKTMIMVAGKKAYPWLRIAEDVVQGTVSYAKTNLLVRYGVIWVANEMSNTLHGFTWGIGPLEQAKWKREAFLEIIEYVENEKRRVKLNMALAAEPRSSNQARKIEAKIQALHDANHRLNIWPLIDAGEFNTVAEDLTQTDISLTKGQFGEHLETMVERYVPDGFREVGRQVQMSKDTALFQALNKAVQYSDFLSKYAVYKKLHQVGGRTDAEIMRIVRNEFVNYNLPAGRTRDALESNGILWFFNYKLRILKVMANAMRDRPASALLMMGGAGPLTGIDSVASGSLAGGLVDGNIGYLVGVDMGLNNLVANPLVDNTVDAILN